MIKQDAKLLRIGVFYDGNYFLHVSNYYNFSHHRKSRISISGLHQFIRHHAAEKEGVNPALSQVVDAHYFRGRLPAQEAKNRNKLLSERLFEDILMKEGVITHFLPLNTRANGEKGIDVWLALEAYEMAALKQYDLLVLIACDSDFVPLVRKLNAMGTRVMVMAWDFEYVDEFGNRRVTVTAQTLINEASYPVNMHDIIDDKTRLNSTLLENLFVPGSSSDYESNNNHYSNHHRGEHPHNGGSNSQYQSRPIEQKHPQRDKRLVGQVQNVKEGYGFIETDSPGRNLFFYWEDVDGDFNEIQPGDWVEYSLGYNHRGECAIEIVLLDGEPEDFYNRAFEDEDDHAYPNVIDEDLE